jgi:hypothetical protein
MITFRYSWILGLCAMAACGGRSPLDDGTGSSAAVGTDTGLPPCKGGLSQCGKRKVSLCYDLNRSRDNCGACGHVCAPGIACEDGVCQQVRCQGPLTFQALPAVTIKNAQVSPYRPALGDFDGDGNLDLAGVAEITDPGGILAGAHLLTGTSLLYGAGDGTFPVTARIDTSEVSNWRLTSADLDGDSNLDLVSIRDYHSAVTVRRGTGNRASPFDQATTYATSQPPDSLIVTDLNSDGLPDLVAGVDTNLEHWRGVGAGRFEHQATLPSRGSTNLLLATDWNRDGALDLVFGSLNLHLRYGRGDGTFDPELVCGLGLGGEPIAPFHTVADLDHDGTIDMVVRPNGVLLGLDGCNPGKVIPIAGWDSGPIDTPLEIVDMNGDGNLDILSLFEVYLGNGKGDFAEHVSLPLGNHAMLLVGDLNRDGRLDVISVGGGWQVMLNTCR